jgi:hypothetical protein
MLRRNAIPLVARDGSSIDNEIDPPPSPNLIALTLSKIDRVMLANTTELREASGVYNCHGLVFASRRTNVRGIDRDLDIDDLLTRDGYQRVAGPQVGNIIAYRDERGEIEHTGFVSAVDTIGMQPVTWVWSKWGALGERLHKAEHCLYSPKRIEYWRLK